MNDTDTFLLPLGICQPLMLGEIEEATLLPQNEDRVDSVLEIQLSVEPFGALFHATITFQMDGGVEESANPSNSEDDGARSNASLKDIDLMRMDWYSDTSSCVPDGHPHLRPLCLCY